MRIDEACAHQGSPDLNQGTRDAWAPSQRILTTYSSVLRIIRVLQRIAKQYATPNNVLHFPDHIWWESLYTVKKLTLQAPSLAASAP